MITRCKECDYSKLKEEQRVLVVTASAVPGDKYDSKRGTIEYIYDGLSYCPYFNSDDEQIWEPICRIGCIINVF